MSGVIIDVDTRAESSKKDLASLNRSLASLITGAGRAKGSLNGIRADGLSNLNKDVARSTAAMTRLGTSGQASMNQIAQGVRSVTNDIGLLKSGVFAAAAGFAALKAVGSLNAMSDDLTNVQNRLRLVTNGTYELMQAQREMLRLSNDTRSSVQGTTSLYVAFANAMSKAGVSQERLVAGVRVIQQAAAVSNMGVESTNAAITQLNQGLSSGTLRGEELNSVLEQMPYLGQQLAVQLKMTTGEMRNFAAEGKLTTDIVFKALEGMAARTDVAFRSTNASVAQGRAAFKQTIAYNIADLNAYLGISAAFARGLMTNAERFEGASDRMIQKVSLIRSSLKGYLNEIERSNVLTSTFKAALRFEFLPFSATEQFKQRKLIKAHVKTLQTLFNKNETVEVNANPTGLARVFGARRTDPAEEDPAESANKLRKRVRDIVDLSATMYEAFAVSVRNTARLLPRLYLPLNTYIDQLELFFVKSRVGVSAWVANTIRPASRGIEAFNEVLSVFATGDMRVERAWVNLFKSENLETFTANLAKLNTAREQLKLNDKAAFGRIELFRFDVANDSIERVLIQLGLMENRFRLKIPVAEITSKLKTVGSIIQRVYADVLAPKLEPAFRKLSIQIRTAANSLASGLRNTFTRNVGERLGRVVGEGFEDAFLYIFDSWEGFENVDFSEQLVTAVQKISAALAGPLTRLRDFISGFFKGLFDNQNVFDDVFDGFNSNPLEKMFNSISKTANDKLNAVQDRVKSFGTFIKDVFFDIWDKVVGHSYWPDMVDGVVDYTRNLSKALPSFDKLGDQVKDVFKGLKSSVRKGLDEVSDLPSQLYWNLFKNLAKAEGKYDFKFNLNPFEKASRDFLRMTLSLMVTAEYQLARVEERIYKFGSTVKDVFFDIWDKVVGHSYWPDMIDSVVDYTENLFKADTKIERFGESIKRTFSKALSEVAQLGRDSGGVFGKVVETLSNVNWNEALKKLSDNVGGAVLAGIFLAFGAPQMKLAAVSYLLSIFNVALNNTLGVIGPGLASIAGSIGGEFAGHLVEGFLRSANIVVNAIPAFIESFTTALLAGVPIIGDIVKLAFSWFPLVSNNLVLMAAGLAGLSAFFFADTRKSIVTALFGTPARIRKDGTVVTAAVMGLLPVMQSMLFGWVPKGAGQFVNNFFSGFRDKKFAIAGALALSSMLLESVTMVEALQVGVPLLGLALLGPEGGLRLAKDSTTIILSTIKAMGNLAAGAIKQHAPTRGFLAAIFGAGAVGLEALNGNDFGDEQKKVVTTAFGTLFKTLSEIPGNLARNGDAYGQNKMGLLAAMFTGPLEAPAAPIADVNGLIWDSVKGDENGLRYFTAKVAPIREQFSAAVNSVLDFAPDKSGRTLNNTFGVVFKSLLDQFNAFKLQMGEGGGWAKIGAAISSVFEITALSVRRSLGLMRDGLLALFTLLRNKFVLILLISGLFAGAAKAATDAGGAISELTSNFAGLVTTVLGAVVALKTLGIVFRTVKAFNTGKAAFELANPLQGGGTKAGLAAASTYLGDIGSSIVNGVSELINSPRTDLKSARRNAVANREMFDAGTYGPFRPGPVMYGPQRPRVAEQYGPRANNAHIYANLLRDSLADLSSAPSIQKLNTSFKLLGKTGTSSFKNVTGAMTGTLEAAAKGPGILGTLANGFFVLGSIGVASLRAMAVAAWSFVAPLLPLIGAVLAIGSVVGLLGVMLFGKGNTFFDKLAWAYDKIRAMLGLTQVTDQGRRSAIQDALKPREIDGVTYDFSATIERVDFEGMSNEMFGTVKTQAEETGKAIDELSEAYRRQGFISAKQRQELDDMYREQESLLGRQQQRPVRTISESLDDANAEISRLDNSLRARINRLFGQNRDQQTFVTTPTRRPETRLSAAIRANREGGGPIGRWWTSMPERERRVSSAIAQQRALNQQKLDRFTEYNSVRYFGATPTTARQSRASNVIADSKAALQPVESLISQDDTDNFTALIAQYRDAQTLANTFETTKFTGRFDGERETYEAYQVRKLAAIQEADLLERRLIIERQRLQEKGIKQLKITTFQAFLASSVTNIKDQLDIDFGEGGRDFVGTGEELREFNNAAKRVADLNAQIATTANSSQLAILNSKRLAEQARSQAEAERIKAEAFFSTSNEFLSGVTGDSAQSIGAMFAVNPEDFKAYKTVADDLADVNTQLANVPTNAPDAQAQIARLTDEALNLSNQLAQLGPKAFSIEAINAEFQKVNIPEVTLDQYLYFSPEHIRGLQGSFQAVEIATNEVQAALSKLGDDDVSLQRYIESLRKLRREIQNTQAVAAALTAADVRERIAERGSGAASARAVGDLTGIVTTARGLQNAERVVALSQELLDIRARLELYDVNETASADVDREITRDKTKEEQLVARLNALNAPLESGGGGTPRLLSDILGRLSEVGIAVDAVNFTRLAADARSSLSSIGVNLDIIAKRIEKAKPGDDISALLARRAELFNDARVKLLDTLYNTGAGLSAAFSRVGVADNAAIARLDPTDAAGLLALDRESENLRLQRDQVNTQEEFFAITRKMADLDRERLAYAARLDKTLEEQVSTINDVFNASLEAADVRFFGADMVSQLSGIAAGLQIELQRAVDGLTSRLGDSLEEAFSTFTAIQRRGQLVGLFREFETSLADALGRGARTGFERMSNLVEGITLDDYLQVDRSTRQALTQEDVALESLGNVLDSGALNDEMIRFINENFTNGNMSAVDTMRGLEAIPAFNEDVMSLFVTPMEALNDTTRQLVEATLDNVAALRGQSVERLDTPTSGDRVNELDTVIVNGVPVRRPSSNPVLSPTVTEVLDEDAYGRVERGVRSNAAARIAGAAGPNQRRLAIALAQLSGVRIEVETINLASRTQLDQLNQLGGDFAHYTEQMALAQKGITTALTIPELQTRINEIGLRMQDLGDYIEDAARRMAEAGRTLSDDVRSNLVDSVKAFAKGDMSLNDVVGSFLDTLTASIVDRFIEGLMDPLTGEGGLLDQLLRGLGESIFGAGQLTGGKRGHMEGATSGLSSALGNVMGSGAKPVAEPLANLGNKFVESTSQLTGGVKVPMETLSAGIDSEMPLLTKALTDISPSGEGGGLAGMLGGLFGGGGGGKGGGGGLGSLFSGGAGMWGALGGIFGSLLGGMFAEGGLIGGHGTGTSDSMIIGASKGEFMINAAATRKHYPLIKAINNGKLSKMMPKFAEGGLIAPSLIAAMPMSTMDAAARANSPTKGNTTTVNLGITGDVSRQTKAEIFRMLPDITNGVNAVNRERG